MILRKYRAPRLNLKLDPVYCRWIRTQPCVVCSKWGLRMQGYAGFVECAHVGMRGLRQKCDDRETIPLCVWHHRTGPHSVHAGKGFWSHWKLNRYELIAEFNRRFERREENAA